MLPDFLRGRVHGLPCIRQKGERRDRKVSCLRRPEKANPSGARLPATPDHLLLHEIHHKKSKVECEICHGPVADRDSLGQEKSIAMADCMACHDRIKASNDCNLCHDSH